jgi:hypothetical protein
MATAKSRRMHRRPPWLTAGAVVVAIVAALGWFYRAPLYGYAETGAAVGARTACSCRYIAGRTLKDCKKDFEPRMEAVFLSDDEDAKSVTGYVPLLASETARYRKGYGCVLDPFDE